MATLFASSFLLLFLFVTSSAQSIRNTVRGSLLFQDLISTDGTAAVPRNGDFSIVMVTDIQFFFQICKNEPYSECIFDNKPPAKRGKSLKRAGARQVKCVDALKNSLGDVEAVFNNGDVTNKGTADELATLQSKFDGPMKTIGLPLVVCLGNHDYGKSKYGDDARVRMVNYLADEIVSLHNTFTISSIDFERTGMGYDGAGGYAVYTRGSLCFSIEIKGYVFLIMHWAPSINSRGIFEDRFQWKDPSTTVTHDIEITSAVSWFTSQVNGATYAGKKIVIVPHSLKGLQAFITGGSLESTVEASNIELVLSGHVHDNWGYYKTLTYGSKDIKAYYAGSTSYQKLIVFSVNSGLPTPGWKVTPYDTSNGSRCKVTTEDRDDSS